MFASPFQPQMSLTGSQLDQQQQQQHPQHPHQQLLPSFVQDFSASAALFLIRDCLRACVQRATPRADVRPRPSRLGSLAHGLTGPGHPHADRSVPPPSPPPHVPPSLADPSPSLRTLNPLASLRTPRQCSSRASRRRAPKASCRRSARLSASSSLRASCPRRARESRLASSCSAPVRSLRRPSARRRLLPAHADVPFLPPRGAHLAAAQAQACILGLSEKGYKCNFARVRHSLLPPLASLTSAGSQGELTECSLTPPAAGDPQGEARTPRRPVRDEPLRQEVRTPLPSRARRSLTVRVPT